MELIIKETKTRTCNREESHPQEPQFKIENGTLVRCELNGCTTVTIPADVKIIGRLCFAVTNVEEVILPKGIESIESKAFVDCTKLKKINFPEGLEAVKNRAFMNCSSLTEVALPETLTEIGDYAFCSAGIEQLTLSNPKNVLSTGTNVFTAIKIKDINIPKDFRLNKSMFSDCQQLRSVNFEADWVTIPENCFYYCTNLAEIDISKALFIRDEAFRECYSLSVNVIPAHTYVYIHAFSETGVKDVTIGDISKIEKGAFSECTSLKRLTINIPDGLPAAVDLSVPEELAAHCTSLQTVVFTGHPENLSIIRAAAFIGTTSLTEITLPDNICLIEKLAFCGSGIKAIHLPNNLKQIGIRAFRSSDLKSITIPDKTVKLGKSVFENCVHLTEIALPESVTTIPEQGFINCVSLETVNASNINTVCCGAFSHCVSLEAFDFSQIKELGSRSFFNSGLNKVVLSDKLPKLQPSTFCNCKNLQQVDISACNKIKTISAHCFANCSSLEDVKLPPHVHKFDNNCFKSVRLDKLVIKAGMRINFYAFSEASINELEFVDDAAGRAKTVVDQYAFEAAEVGRLIIPDHMYDKFKNAISKIK